MHLRSKNNIINLVKLAEKNVLIGDGLSSVIKKVQSLWSSWVAMLLVPPGP
jgi:hypothetical protein